MNNRFSVASVAKALSVTDEELQSLLDRSGIAGTCGMLNDADVRILMDYLAQQQQQAGRRSEEYLDKMVRSYTILVDTCALLNKAFPKLSEHICPYLRKYGKALLVPSSVVNELKKKSLDFNLRPQVQIVSHILKQMQDEGLAEVRGDESKGFGDQQFLEVATRLRQTTSVLVLTMDHDLSEDLLKMNSYSSVRGRQIAVCRINRYGYLTRYRRDGEMSRSWSYSAGTACSVSAAEPVKDSGKLLPVAAAPREGDTVCGTMGSYCLMKKLASGGEGTIYDLGDGTVAKIYHLSKLTEMKRDKLTELVRAGVSCEGVCMPMELLYSGNTFVGYRMQKADGVEMQRCLFTRQGIEKHFPQWNKCDVVQLCVTILEKICKLHQYGIILGDINPLNILVKSPTEVWFVDCDSYQIAGYPCPVGTVRFTAPEIQKCSFQSFLRTESQESFAVATLLFMLMLPGKSPYAQQGAEDLSEAICAMQFPYGCGMTYTENMPDGDWRFIWSHLPYFIKSDFYETFQRGGRYSTPDTRLSLQSWLDAFRSYLDLLTSGKLEEQDAESMKIFPTRGKQVIEGAGEVVQTLCCVDCGESFDLTRGERNYMVQYHLALPRRCPACRHLRKLSKHLNMSEELAQWNG